MSEILEAVFSVAQVVEKPQSSGYEVLAIGRFSAPQPTGDVWDGIEDPKPRVETFPDLGIGAELRLDWLRFAGEKPLAAYHGSTYRVTVEFLTVPTEPIRDPDTLQIVGRKPVDRTNGGLQGPKGRRY